MFWNKKDIRERLEDAALEFAKKAKAPSFIKLIEETRKAHPKYLGVPIWPLVSVFIKTHPQEEQESFYNFILEKTGFPKYEALGKRLTDINNTPWFTPQQTPDTKTLEEYVNYCVETFELNKYEVDGGQMKARVLEPFKVISDEWKNLLERMDRSGSVADAGRLANELRSAVKEARLKDKIHGLHGLIWYAVWSHAHLETNNPIIDLTGALQAEMSWTLVEDRMEKKGYKNNPYTKLVEFYKLGVWPIGLVGQGLGKDAFTVFIPSISK